MGFDITDIGGDQAEIDFLNSPAGQAALLAEDRSRRINQLNGKYVVSITGRASGKPVFYQQDRFKRQQRDYWTQYLANAEGLSKKKAEIVAEKICYGNPKIFRVFGTGKLEESK